MVIRRCDKCGNRMSIWFAVDVEIKAANNTSNVAEMMPYKGEYQICLDCWSSFIKG